MTRELTAARELRAQAEREEREAVARLARVRRDYQDGKLDAADWREQREQLTEEQQAAQAKLAHLVERERGLVEGGPLKDAEAATLARIAEIRAAIAGEVAAAADVEAVRAALVRLFERFHIGRVITQDADLQAETVEVEFADGSARYTILPEPRASVIEALGIGWQPILRQEALLPGVHKDQIA
jgi:hypothetical protein